MEPDEEVCGECGYQCTSSKECVENQELVDLNNEEED